MHTNLFSLTKDLPMYTDKQVSLSLGRTQAAQAHYQIFISGVVLHRFAFIKVCTGCNAFVSNLKNSNVL